MYRVTKCSSGQYGLAGGTDKDEIEVEDLFVSYREISVFAYFLNKFDVAPYQVADIIEDYFGNFGFLEQLLWEMELT